MNTTTEATVSMYDRLIAARDWAEAKIVSAFGWVSGNVTTACKAVVSNRFCAGVYNLFQGYTGVIAGIVMAVASLAVSYAWIPCGILGATFTITWFASHNITGFLNDAVTVFVGGAVVLYAILLTTAFGAPFAAFWLCELIFVGLVPEMMFDEKTEIVHEGERVYVREVGVISSKTVDVRTNADTVFDRA